MNCPPLTQEDVRNVLVVATAFDNRKPSAVMLAAWVDALNIAGPFPAADAVEAVKRHYAASTEYLMPAHVADGCRAIQAARREAIPPVETLMAGVDPDDPAWQQIRRDRENAILAGVTPAAIEAAR